MVTLGCERKDARTCFANRGGIDRWRSLDAVAFTFTSVNTAWTQAAHSTNPLLGVTSSPITPPQSGSSSLNLMQFKKRTACFCRTLQIKALCRFQLTRTEIIAIRHYPLRKIAENSAYLSAAGLGLSSNLGALVMRYGYFYDCCKGPCTVVRDHRNDRRSL